MISPSRRLGRRGLCLLVILSWSLLGKTTLATTFQRLTLEQFVREADLIVLGRVREITSQESPDRSAITTSVVFAVKEQWKGVKVSTVTLRQPGGSVGEITQRVMEVPQFSVGEELILFLKKQKSGHYITVGGKQGKFTIKTDPQSGSKTVEDLTGKSQDHESFLRRLKEVVGN